MTRTTSLTTIGCALALTLLGTRGRAAHRLGPQSQRCRRADETAERVWKQYAVDTVYRFLADETLFGGLRYNRAIGAITGITGEAGANRWQVGGGWFVTPHILEEAGYVNQTFFGYQPTHIRNGGKFNRLISEGVVAS